MNEEFIFKQIRKGPMVIGPFRVTALRMDHPVEAYGFRIECHGRTLAYSGDSARCGALVELSRDADLLLAEAAFRDDADNPRHLHMTGSEAAGVAQEAGVGMLVLTHIPPWHDKQEALHEAAGHYGGPVLLAAEGSTYQV
jgi:ribonuclease BN (tRNA processing enzyme)